MRRPRALGSRSLEPRRRGRIAPLALAAALLAAMAVPRPARGDRTVADLAAGRPGGARPHIALMLRIGAAIAPFETRALSQVESEFTQARLLVLAGRQAWGRRLLRAGRPARLRAGRGGAPVRAPPRSRGAALARR